jgi:hypothetical protein
VLPLSKYRVVIVLNRVFEFVVVLECGQAVRKDFTTEPCSRVITPVVKREFF